MWRIVQKSEYCLKNSYQFANEIKNMQIPDGYVMSSFDVISLFNKGPIAKTLEYMKKRMQEDEDWQTRTSLTLNEIIELTTICTEGNYFQWNNLYYKLADGTPMGSPA